MAAKRAQPTLDPRMPMRDVAPHLVAQRLHALQKRLERFIEDRDVEELHDLRVAARRFRVALQCCAEWLPKRRAREALEIVREFFKNTGKRREFDVLLALATEWSAEGGPAAASRRLLENVERRRVAADRKVFNAAGALSIDRIAHLLRAKH